MLRALTQWVFSATCLVLLEYIKNHSKFLIVGGGRNNSRSLSNKKILVLL